MKPIYFVLLFTLTLSLAQGQTKEPFINLDRGIGEIRTAPGQRYLQLIGPTYRGPTPNAMKAFLIFDFETGKADYYKEQNSYTSFSPNYSYFASSLAEDIGPNRVSYSNTLKALKGGARGRTPSNDYMVLEVFDDGDVLATKAKTDGMGSVKSQSGLYLLDSKTGSATEIFGKKLDSRSYMDQGHTAFSPSKDQFWKEKYLEIEVVDFPSAKVSTIKPQIDGMKITNVNDISAVNGQYGIIKITISGHPQYKYFYALLNPDSGKVAVIGEGSNEYTATRNFWLGEDKLYEIMADEKKVDVYNIQNSQPEFYGSYSFETIGDRLNGPNAFAIGGDEKLAIIPTEYRQDGAMIIFDLKSQFIEFEVPVFVKDPAKTSAIASGPQKPVKKVFNNVFLNSFDPLPLPYILDYGRLQGRAVTLPNGNAASAIGLLGYTAQGHPIVLTMRRYMMASSDNSRFSVSIYDENAKFIAGRELGYTQLVNGQATAKVVFAISRSGNNIVFDIEQVNGKAKNFNTVTVNTASGLITGTN